MGTNGPRSLWGIADV